MRSPRRRRKQGMFTRDKKNPNAPSRHLLARKSNSSATTPETKLLFQSDRPSNPRLTDPRLFPQGPVPQTPLEGGCSWTHIKRGQVHNVVQGPQLLYGLEWAEASQLMHQVFGMRVGRAALPFADSPVWPCTFTDRHAANVHFLSHRR